MIAEDAANFFFPANTSWTSLTEVRLNDKNGNTAGNIDVVLVAYDEAGKVTDFGALEIQAVYITGNIRRPFEHYMNNPQANENMDWRKETGYPHPDYLSSSRKRLVPQLLYKGGILNAWNKKIAVALDEGFFSTLPNLKEVDANQADIAWQIYSLKFNKTQGVYSLQKTKLAYTMFQDSLEKIIRPEIGSPQQFVDTLQQKLDEKLESNPPENHTIGLNNLNDSK